MEKNLFDKQYQFLNEAYRNTIFRCLDPEIEILIGESHPRLDQYLNRKHVQDLCILSAFNPFSEIRTDDENNRNQGLLRADLQDSDYCFLDGINIDPEGDFPSELSVWVLGMNRQTGIEFTKRWHQNAYVYYPMGGKAELIWCR